MLIIVKKNINEGEFNKVSVLLGDQPITEDSECFIPPQPDEGLDGVEVIDGGPAESLVNATEIAQIENVVEFDWSSRQLLFDGLKQLQRHLRDLLRQLVELLVVEFRNVVRQDGGVDFVLHFRARKQNIEDRKKREESRVHSVGPSSRRKHRPTELSVLDVALIPLRSLVNVALFDEETQEGNGLLGSVLIDLRHVHVVDENDELLAWYFGPVDFSRAFVSVVVDGVLQILRGCP